MLSEFQKPCLMPSQASPVQSVFHAFHQGSKVQFTGSAKIRPTVISSTGLNEVTITT